MYVLPILYDLQDLYDACIQSVQHDLYELYVLSVCYVSVLSIHKKYVLCMFPVIPLHLQPEVETRSKNRTTQALKVLSKGDKKLINQVITSLPIS